MCPIDPAQPVFGEPKALVMFTPYSPVPSSSIEVTLKLSSTVALLPPKLTQVFIKPCTRLWSVTAPPSEMYVESLLTFTVDPPPPTAVIVFAKTVLIRLLDSLLQSMLYHYQL